MRIVALTFHDVVSDDAKSGTGHDEFYSISVSEFERLLAQLRKLGYQTVSSREFRQWQQGKAELPKRAVMLTFDDGYTSHAEIVAPLLRRYSYSGTFFVTGDYIGRPGHVTWEQLRKMVFLGMEIGSHGLTHRPLTSLPRAEVDRELGESKRLLEANLGMPVHSMAAPGGYWNRAVSDAVQQAGYEAAWISAIGTNGTQTQPMALRRVVVRRPFALDRIISMVEGWQPSFWWAVNQQFMIRLLKRVLGVYWYEQLKRRLVPDA